MLNTTERTSEAGRLAAVKSCEPAAGWRRWWSAWPFMPKSPVFVPSAPASVLCVHWLPMSGGFVAGCCAPTMPAKAAATPFAPSCRKS